MNKLKGSEGGCLCGAVRYRLEENPMYVQACHCTDCQTVSGSAFVVNLWIEKANVTRLGDSPVSFMNIAGSGKGHEIFHCKKCGTDVFSKYYASPGDDLMVRAGTLDDTSGVEPLVHIFTRSKQPWVRIPDDKPSFKGFYRVFDLWPAHSTERLTRLMKQASGR